MVTEQLVDAGWTELGLSESWSDLPDRGVVRHHGAILAWHTPSSAEPTTGFRLVGAHTDSPGLKVKPHPDHQSAGWNQLNVEVYGGILNNSWLDRDLGLAGRVIDTDGTAYLVNIAEPVARIPQLAVHLDRQVNTTGLILNAQQHLRPVWGTTDQGGFRSWLAEHTGIENPTTWELGLYDIQPAALLGADRSLLASGRLDNLVSCWAATKALIEASAGSAIEFIVLNDHEEVGSSSTTGAAGPLLERILERHVIARGGERDDFLRALSISSCVSADNAHAVHPNYLDRHDVEHAPIVNHGPAIKINAQQRYATSAVTAAEFQSACTTAEVPCQTFVSHNAMPCGSTIGPITATRLGIATVDVGVPQLSMHSAREVCGVKDPVWLAQALTAWFSR